MPGGVTAEGPRALSKSEKIHLRKLKRPDCPLYRGGEPRKWLKKPC